MASGGISPAGRVHAPLPLATEYQVPLTRTDRLAAVSLTTPLIAGEVLFVVSGLTATVNGGAASVLPAAINWKPLTSNSPLPALAAETTIWPLALGTSPINSA